MSDPNSGTHEYVPEPSEGSAICAKCKEEFPTSDLLIHLAVCQGIDITKADEWPIVTEGETE